MPLSAIFCSCCSRRFSADNRQPTTDKDKVLETVFSTAIDHYSVMAVVPT
jgi:hypothetical protein